TPANLQQRSRKTSESQYYQKPVRCQEASSLLQTSSEPKNEAAAHKQSRLQRLSVSFEPGRSVEDTCKHGNLLQRAK
ncbi:hypothetical protein CU098_010774, partial [Rhizopus stolonifer]